MSQIILVLSRKIVVLGLIALFSISVCQQVFATNSLRFFGTPTNDDHRVKIRIDDPANSDPGPPADIGAEDFTLEFWMKAASGNNATESSPCAAGWGSWVQGNIIIDRDRFNQGQSFGISIVDGVLWFGLDNSAQTAHTICGTTNVLDGQWYHVAVQRRISDGWIQLYVNGVLEAEADGPDGDISYPDDGIPGNFCGGLCDFSDPFLVIGAEKHDANVNAYPSYSGLIDEVRLSNSIRYNGASFSIPTQAFIADENTVALYHFDEGSGTHVYDTSGAVGGPSNGVIQAGVDWTTETPFSGGNTSSPGTLQFAVVTQTVNESDGTVLISVGRMGGTNGEVSVDFLVSGGSATVDVDYDNVLPASGTLIFQDGETSANITLTILDDEITESLESIEFTLSDSFLATLGDRNMLSLYIEDNDSAGSDSSTSTNDGGVLSYQMIVFLLIVLFGIGRRK